MIDDSETTDYQYEKLSWPEIDAAIEDDAMLLVPVGSTEDHGPHLPVDVDCVIPETICDLAASERDDVLLFPTIEHGYLPHHMDFPGGVTIGWETYVNYLIDVCVSLAHHGFDKMLLVNGHGSNHHLIELATRQVILQYPDVHCAMLSWWELEEVGEVARELRDSGPHGNGHAEEMETSIYMYLHPEEVDTENAPRDVNYPESKHFYSRDMAGERDPGWSTPVTMVEWWSTLSDTGTCGDPSVASAEKGEALLEAAVSGLHSVLDELAEYPLRDRVDHHSRDVDDREYDTFRPR